MEQLEEIKWTDDFSVGVAAMDEQHKNIIRIINRLLRNPRVDTRSETISEILNEMTDYALRHFRAEEDLLSEHDYPKLDEQKLHHKEFRRKTVDYCNATMLGTSVVPDSMLNYLRDWWINHILSEDMQYRSFFQDLDLQ